MLSSKLKLCFPLEKAEMTSLFLQRPRVRSLEPVIHKHAVKINRSACEIKSGSRWGY